MVLVSTVASLLLLSGAANAASPAVGSVITSPSENIQKSTTLAYGTSYVAGKINSNLYWQASGVLLAGGCLRPNGVVLKSCFQMSLTAQGQLESGSTNQKRDLGEGLSAEERAMLYDEDLDAYFEVNPEQARYRYLPGASYTPEGKRFMQKQKRQDAGDGSSVASSTVSSTATSATATPTGRQRIEIYTWPGALANETWNYKWTSWQRPGISTSAHFWHAWQILRRDGSGGPVITLDYKASRVVFTDTVAGCTACVTSSLRSWYGIVAVHEMNITYGPQGNVSYSVADSHSPDVPIITYQAVHDMGSSASLKMGTYRLVIPNASDTKGFVGSFVGTRLG
ncbi:hypothetical protein T439DRAFT_381037 [Meredithblackwellia eburnea MCA 4105]